jgi:ribosomal protein L35
MKTNKSYSKRLKLTKNGKVIARHTGQNHFNAKERRRAQLAKKRGVPFIMTQKSKSRFLTSSKLQHRTTIEAVHATETK